MRLQWGVYPHVRRDMVSLRACRVAALPEAGEAEIARGLSPDVLVTEVCGRPCID